MDNNQLTIEEISRLIREWEEIKPAKEEVIKSLKSLILNIDDNINHLKVLRVLCQDALVRVQFENQVSLFDREGK